MNRPLVIIFFSFTLAALTACSNDEPTAKPTPKPAPQGGHVHDDGTVHADGDEHDHAEGDGHNHGDDAHAPGHGGSVVELGAATIGEWSVRASRDVGEVKAGGDAPIDVWLSAGAGSTGTVVAVRFWIGTEDASGSLKARAEIADPAEPNHWHTHAEAPNPMPAGAKLWVEIEAEGGAKTAGSFDLKLS